MKADVPCLAADAIAVPGYLQDIYWWAYVDPRAVRLFEREWLVNLILWGNYGRLRDAAIEALGPMAGRTLQIACVYGDLTTRICRKTPRDGSLDVVDVLAVQLDNLARKLPRDSGVGLYQGDSSRLAFASSSYDQALLFFLLHEQPAQVRRKTISEAMRVVKPGGRLVIVDYHRPHGLNPLYWPMVAILKTLEPFALDLWTDAIEDWLPQAPAALQKTTSFGGLYQLLTVTT
jgi:ubiquinone/menaquinone biosynthesis C-methylase UbiE